MIYPTVSILIEHFRDYFNVDEILFGHPDRVAKKMYNHENNTISTDFMILHHEAPRANDEIATNHNWNLSGLTIRDENNRNDVLVEQVVPVILPCFLSGYCSSRNNMNDMMRRFYFINANRQINVDLRNIYNVTSDKPIHSPIVINIMDVVDETNYYSGDDKLVYRPTFNMEIETFMVNPLLAPLISSVDASIYDDENNLLDKHHID